jgi:hypothetical protein
VSSFSFCATRCAQGRLDDLSYQPGQFPLCLDGVLAPDNLPTDEGEVVADEHVATERNTFRKVRSLLFRKPTVGTLDGLGLAGAPRPDHIGDVIRSLPASGER